MRLALYNFLVNKHPGIQSRYHKMHDNSQGMKKFLSHLYLLWLNFAYYVLFCRFLAKDVKVTIYEEKNISVKETEQQTFYRKNKHVSVEEFVNRLSQHEVVSFDIFDTLIFRPVSQPDDIFNIIGERIEYMDFYKQRGRAEFEARKIHAESLRNEKKRLYKACDSRYKDIVVDYEVNLEDIWNRMHTITGLDPKEGMRIEEEVEYDLCYANPFMKEVFDRLRKSGKRIIITSDMYLSEDFLVKMLAKNGYTGYERIFISNKYHKSKSDGRLYEVVKSELRVDDIIHVGDNVHSDIEMAKKHGLATLYYPNVNKETLEMRPYDMSPIIGGAYRGIVNNKLYNGLEKKHSFEYEYGYVYGGLFVMGYCAHIHRFAKANGIDKLLFLSRDGDILKQVYEIMYPDEETEYIYWSRRAATILSYDLDRNDYYRRFIYHKINQFYSIEKTLKAMELESLAKKLEGFKIGKKEACLVSDDMRDYELHIEDELTEKKTEVLKYALEELEDEIRTIYSDRDKAAQAYFSEKLSGAKKALAIDIGWAGSGAIALRRLCREKWDIQCEIVGMIAGTNTIHNAEPYQTETFMQMGILNSYLYSMSFNRDIMKKHNPGKDYNVFLELLLGSPTRQFRGFKFEDGGQVGFDFGDYDDNVEGICDVQNGILDFVRGYMGCYQSPVDGKYREMYNISGRDAYAPIIVAASSNEKYLKKIKKLFDLDPNVD